jgi:hypothetical protein
MRQANNPQGHGCKMMYTNYQGEDRKFVKTLLICAGLTIIATTTAWSLVVHVIEILEACEVIHVVSGSVMVAGKVRAKRVCVQGVRVQGSGK